MIEATNSAIQTAVIGLNKNISQVEKAAENIAGFGTSEGASNTLVQDIVNLKVGEYGVKANAKVLEVSGELSDQLGQIFDESV